MGRFWDVVCYDLRATEAKGQIVGGWVFAVDVTRGREAKGR